jgi:hypothetical protein
MKYLILLFLSACTTVPQVIPDVSRPSVMEESIKHNLSTSGEPSYLWLLWYIPLLVLSLSWTWKAFLKPKETKNEQ